jgi:hypothetical protein
MMTRLRAVALIWIAVLLLTSCMSGSTSPLAPGAGGDDNAALVQAVQQAVAGLAQDINAEDLNAMRDLFLPLFQLDGNLALRFPTTSTTSDNPNPTSDEITFFNDFFAQNENISCSLEVTDTVVTGSVATVKVHFLLSSLYILDVPPATYQSEDTDLMVFAVSDGAWKLTSWQEDPEGGNGQEFEQQRVLDQLAALSDALNAEDLAAAESLVEPGVLLDRAVQLRFKTAQTVAENPNPPSDFSDFFSTVFVENEEIQTNFSVNSVIILGTRAFLNVGFSLSAVYAGVIPPEAYSASGADEMTFDLVSGNWELATWRETTQEVPGPTEQLLRARASALGAALTAEDAGAFGSIASGLLTLDPAIAMRFKCTSTLSDPPSIGTSFGPFLSEVFSQNANLVVGITVNSVEISGEVAVAELSFTLAATYILALPPENYEAQGTDDSVWEFDGSNWRLVTWREKPAPPA